MTSDTNHEGDAQTTTADADEAAGIAGLTLEDGGLVVYDRDNTDAWIQSGTPLTLEAMA